MEKEAIKIKFNPRKIDVNIIKEIYFIIFSSPIYFIIVFCFAFDVNK